MGDFLMCSQTLRPSSLGRTTSSRTRSGITSANFSIASLPSLHTTARWPASLATNSSIFAIHGSSSTTRIFRPDPAIHLHCGWLCDGLQDLDMPLRREPAVPHEVRHSGAERADEPAVVDERRQGGDGKAAPRQEAADGSR